MADRQAVRHPDYIGTFVGLSMFKVYIIENLSGKLYIGQTSNLRDRLLRHNRGGYKFTSHKGPWKLLFEKDFNTRVEALSYEKYLKLLKSPKYIRERIVK